MSTSSISNLFLRSVEFGDQSYELRPKPKLNDLENGINSVSISNKTNKFGKIPMKSRKITCYTELFDTLNILLVEGLCIFPDEHFAVKFV